MNPASDQANWNTDDSATFVRASAMLGAIIAACSTRLSREDEPNEAEVRELSARIAQERRDLAVTQQDRCAEILRTYPQLLADVRAGTYPWPE